MKRADWTTDADFEDVLVVEVEKAPVVGGYSLRQAGGLTLFIDDPGFEPPANRTYRYFGRGMGFPVRGVVLLGKGPARDDGARVLRYRTVEEYDQADMDRRYPPTASEALARWDSGEALFTVEMGGLGPGYEQAIHVTVFELIRYTTSADDFERAAKMVQMKYGAQLGLSGAQWGAARSLAYRAIVHGWQKTIKSVPDDRQIQVSKAWPHLEAGA